MKNHSLGASTINRTFLSLTLILYSSSRLCIVMLKIIRRRCFSRASLLCALSKIDRNINAIHKVCLDKKFLNVNVTFNTRCGATKTTAGRREFPMKRYVIQTTMLMIFVSFLGWLMKKHVLHVLLTLLLALKEAAACFASSSPSWRRKSLSFFPVSTYLSHYFI